MDIQFSARHFNASAGLQDRIQEEMDKLAKFYPNITSASVILDHEVEHLRHCEISVNITGICRRGEHGQGRRCNA